MFPGDCSSDGFLHDASIENETAYKAEADDAEWCEEEAGEAGPPLRCPLCPFETRVRESLSRHRRLHARRPLSCPHCDAHYLDQTSLARHLLGHQGGKGALLACPECGTHFTRRDTLEQHMGMHAQRDKPFKCSLCTESFLTYKEMQAHKASHGRKPPHVCEVCGRGYLQLSTLAEHRFSHEEERRFQCGLCDKRFFSSLALKRHNRVHTGERPFRCLTCGLSFAIRAHLLSHKRTHTGERPFSCPSQTCPQAFSTSSAAKRHFLNIHSKNVGGNQGGGPEEEAAEESSRPEGPETENVPFVCEQCGASFRTRAGLSGHVRAHVTSRPYSCPACPRAFTSSGAAARHHRRVHGAPEADVEPATLHRRSEDSEG